MSLEAPPQAHGPCDGFRLRHVRGRSGSADKEDSGPLMHRTSRAPARRGTCTVARAALSVSCAARVCVRQVRVSTAPPPCVSGMHGPGPPGSTWRCCMSTCAVTGLGWPCTPGAVGSCSVPGVETRTPTCVMPPYAHNVWTYGTCGARIAGMGLVRRLGQMLNMSGHG